MLRTGYAVSVLLAVSSTLLAQSPSGRVSSDTDEALTEFWGTISTSLSFKQRSERQQVRTVPLTVEQSFVVPFVQHIDSSTLPSGVSPVLSSEAANSDIILIGVPLSQRALPTQDHSFLFTDYRVRVYRIFSADTKGLAPGDTISVSRQGGAATVDGISVRAIDPKFELFRLGASYIFFLKRIPDTPSVSHAYVADPYGTYRIESGRVIPSATDEPSCSLDDMILNIDLSVARMQRWRH